MYAKDAVISGFLEAKISQESAQSAKARIGIGRKKDFLIYILKAINS